MTQPQTLRTWDPRARKVAPDRPTRPDSRRRTCGHAALWGLLALTLLTVFALGLVLLLASKGPPLGPAEGPIDRASRSPNLPASAPMADPQAPGHPLESVSMDRAPSGSGAGPVLHRASDAVQREGGGDSVSLTTSNPSSDFEKVPGVLGISLRTRRQETLKAYPSETLGAIALGLEDLRLIPGNRDGRLVTNLGELLRYEQKGHEVPKQSRRLLDGIARLLSGHVQTRIEILSHTDDEGDAGFNLRLSQRRAEALKSYLVERGVAPERISPLGRGEEDPLIETGRRTPTRAERAKNRRTEIVIRALEPAASGISRIPEADAGAPFTSAQGAAGNAQRR